MAIEVIDLATISTPEELAAAVKGACQTLGFVAFVNHGLEDAAAEQFAISGECASSLQYFSKM